MEEIKDNIDIILNKQIKKSLLTETKGDFSENVIEAIKLQRKFRTEDIKTNKLVRGFTFVSISLMTIFIFVMSYLFYLREFEFESDIMTGYITFISDVNDKISGLIGIESGLNYLFYTSLILIVLAIFSIVDRKIISKATK